MNETIMRCMNQNKRDLVTCEEKLAQAKQLVKAGKEDEASEILQEIAALSAGLRSGSVRW